jgi:predicted dehydrogenase
METTSRLNRRGFLQRSAAMGMAWAAPLIVPGRVLGLGGPAPSARIALAVIGYGGRCAAILPHFLMFDDVQCVAVSDCRANRLAAVKQVVDTHHGNAACTAYADFRELLARPDIDAVLIATGDRWHTPLSILAAKAGKDIYCEKPVSLTIGEGRTLVDTMARYGAVHQTGHQRRSVGSYRFQVEVARSGMIGQVHTVICQVWEGPTVARDQPRPVPAGFDYDMWLGPAPWAPYTTARLTYPHWFHISDYSLGYVAGWGIHHIDIAQWGNGTELTGPIEIEGTAQFPDDDALCDNPLSWDTRMKYANGVELVFTGSGPGFTGVRHGITFEGPDGWVWVNRGAIDAEPKSLLKEQFGPGDIRLPVSTFHHGNFIECVRSRQKTICNIDVAVRSDTVCQLAWCAFQLQRKLRWNPDQELFVNDSGANRKLTRALRAPWRW